jgi:DNA primase
MSLYIREKYGFLFSVPTVAIASVPSSVQSTKLCPQSSAMPGIHFAVVRSSIPISEVLSLIGFVASEKSGDQVRGPCPVHRSTSSNSRSFSANTRKHIYRCFTCASSGNQLDLYASVTGLRLHEAVVALCKQLSREVPWTESTRLKRRSNCQTNGRPGASR